jgi:hypothetical protein
MHRLPAESTSYDGAQIIRHAALGVKVCFGGNAAEAAEVTRNFS